MKHSKFIQAGAIAALAFSLFAANAAAAAPTVVADARVQSSNTYLTPQSRDDTVLLLVDHQVGLLTGVRDMPVAELKHNVVALAKAAQAMGVSVSNAKVLQHRALRMAAKAGLEVEL